MVTFPTIDFFYKKTMKWIKNCRFLYDRVACDAAENGHNQEFSLSRLGTP